MKNMLVYYPVWKKGTPFGDYCKSVKEGFQCKN
jgi:hypothetical protein